MTDNFDRAPERSRPTHVRWHMMALVTATVVLTYLDRLNLSIAGKYIQDEFAIPLKTMGWILSAFLLGYALSQIPGGYLADRYGPRKVLVVTICWWSVLTAATALAPQMPLRVWFGVAWSFAIVRFLIGIGEAPRHRRRDLRRETPRPGAKYSPACRCWRSLSGTSARAFPSTFITPGFSFIWSVRVAFPLPRAAFGERHPISRLRSWPQLAGPSPILQRKS